MSAYSPPPSALRNALLPIAWLLDSVVYGFLIVTLPLSPLVAAYIAGDKRYVLDYRRTLKQCLLHTGAIRRAKVISRNLLRRKSEISDVVITGSCTHCGRCCTHNTCVFLEATDEGQSRCSIYQSKFFNWLSCGEYPLTADDIAVYDCPSYTAEQRAARPSNTARPLPSAPLNARQGLLQRRVIRVIEERRFR
jgi:hypothetical protein